MTTFEPPHGGEDLASQTADVERENLARDRAHYERDVVLMRTRRADADAQRAREDVAARTLTVDEHGLMMPPPAVGPVIDPQGREYELDAQGTPLLDGRGEPIPVGDYDRDEHGVVVLDHDGNPLRPWPYDTVELQGRVIQARTPKPVALQAFSMATSKGTPPRLQNEMVAMFVRNHISDRSYNELLAAMMDPDDPFTIDHFGELMTKIATLGTARPTGPSRP
ncbi:hypothetical protein NDR87_31390 [Nocardia sp. CDC159]|uniref:Uncharacterized protein n=1 Tax=Nocardia pulmonis TaxID=2951408 RepID=A0A9X2EGK8_9NOCA|nr:MULTISPECIES: hypothetical protein [Nocardia]MCM6777946.1 hypothetical protein [Nocardia pulmonis]MCM6790883.1 hypothetical protein [Nocardia sp. CDC159]